MAWPEARGTIGLAGVLVLLLMGCGSEDQSRGFLEGGGTLVSVNELQPSNQATIADEFGEYDDWIELYNAGEHDAHLEGYFITDSSDRPFEQVLPPEAVVPARGYLLLWADEQPDQGPLHFPFALSAGGESVHLANPNGNLLDGTDYGPPPHGDYSYARIPDGSGAFQWRGPGLAGGVTPGRANVSAGGEVP
jgi:hypothetical protein